MVEALRTIKVKQLQGPELNLSVNPDVSVNKIGHNLRKFDVSNALQ